MTALDRTLCPTADLPPTAYPGGAGDLADLADAGDLADVEVLTDLADRASIERLVRAFYRDVAMDDLLGPVFEAAGVDWPAHIDKLTDFWAWQLLGHPGYQGNPLRAHEPVHRQMPFTEAHFTRWLELFTAAVDDHAAGPAADAAKQRAAKMAGALRLLLAGRHARADEPVRPYLVARHTPARPGMNDGPRSS